MKSLYNLWDQHPYLCIIVWLVFSISFIYIAFAMFGCSNPPTCSNTESSLEYVMTVKGEEGYIEVYQLDNRVRWIIHDTCGSVGTLDLHFEGARLVPDGVEAQFYNAKFWRCMARGMDMCDHHSPGSDDWWDCMYVVMIGCYATHAFLYYICFGWAD